MIQNQTTIFDMLYPKYKIMKPIRLIELFSGYGSQYLALKYLNANVEHFNKWQLALENMGYKNYFQDLIATDYGIPQIRNRCFMVSILGDYSYVFPKPIPLELKLKDMLEEKVDEKYYLSDKMIKYCLSSSSGGFDRSINFINNMKNENIAQTITTKAGDRATDNFICVKNNTKKGYLEATDGDGIDISSRMKYHRGNVQKRMCQTLDSQCGNNKGVVIAQNQLRIRKLTPRECGRLMGVKDEDIDKILKNQSNSSAFHLFGDSIVVNVLMAIFKELL